MAYVKWVANADRHNDWTSELLLKDGTQLKMGVPVDLKADLQKSLEGQGRIFESSSKDELEEYENSEQVIQPPGNDVLGTAPVFSNAGSAVQVSPQESLEEVAETDQSDSGSSSTGKPKQPARSGSNS